MVTSSGERYDDRVAAAGAQAGAAVFDAVLGAELLGRGAIGGFVVFAVLDEQGRLQYRTTQRGGVTALDLPASWRDARVAAVISSGPDRPEPLTQFLAGADGLGLVTGHRLPNQPGADGRPLNRMALDLMAEGAPPQQAIDAVLAAHPEWDAGLIALHAQDGLGLGNNARRGATTWARSSARDSRAAWRCCTTPSTRAACWPMSWADWPGPG